MGPSWFSAFEGKCWCCCCCCWLALEQGKEVIKRTQEGVVKQWGNASLKNQERFLSKQQNGLVFHCCWAMVIAQSLASQTAGQFLRLRRREEMVNGSTEQQEDTLVQFWETEFKMLKGPLGILPVAFSQKHRVALVSALTKLKKKLICTFEVHVLCSLSFNGGKEKSKGELREALLVITVTEGCHLYLEDRGMATLKYLGLSKPTKYCSKSRLTFKCPLLQSCG